MVTCGKSGPQWVLWDDGPLRLYEWQYGLWCGARANQSDAGLGEHGAGTWICKECLIKAGYIW